MMHKLRMNVMINARPEDVYSVARDCQRWGQWYANLSEPKSVKGNCGVGTIVECQYTIMGVHVPMTIEVTEDFKGENECRWSGNIKGPISGRQHCTYMAKDNGTEAVFEIEYNLPEGIIGKLADKLLIEKLQQNALVQTLDNLKVVSEHKVPVETR